jgi:hypothetical protein
MNSPIKLVDMKRKRDKKKINPKHQRGGVYKDVMVMISKFTPGMKRRTKILLIFFPSLLYTTILLKRVKCIDVY